MLGIACSSGGKGRIFQNVGLSREAFRDDQVIIYMLQSLS